MKLCSDMSKPRRAAGGGVFRGGTDIGGARPPGLLAACIMGLGGFEDLRLSSEGPGAAGCSRAARWRAPRGLRCMGVLSRSKVMAKMSPVNSSKKPLFSELDERNAEELVSLRAASSTEPRSLVSVEWCALAGRATVSMCASERGEGLGAMADCWCDCLCLLMHLEALFARSSVHRHSSDMKTLKKAFVDG